MLKNKIAVLVCEYGFGCDTYDFDEIFVEVEYDYNAVEPKIKIKRKLGFFESCYKNIFKKYNMIISFGYGYQERAYLYECLQKNEIDFSKVKISEKNHG